MPPSRRSVLKLIPVFAGILRLPAADRIVRSARPEDFEMPLDGFNTWITPTERFFVRTHVYTPKVDLAGWHLRVEKNGIRKSESVEIRNGETSFIKIPLQ